MLGTRSHLEIALWIVLLIVPLVIGLGWGTVFDDSAYITLRYARNLAAGRELIHNLTVEEQTLPGAPLYVLALSLLAQLGVPLLWAALVLSALGWGAAAIAMYCAGQVMDRPVTAVVSAALMAFCPIVVSTLGTEALWAMALAWAAIAASFKKRWNVQAGLLALALCVHLGPSTVALAILLLVAQWIERRRFPFWIGLVLIVSVLGWGVITVVYRVPVIPRWSLDIGHWVLIIRQLVAESEFYWLFLPLILCGGIELFLKTRKVLWGGVLWAVVAVLDDGAVAGATLATLGLFLAGLGIDWIITQVEAKRLVRLNSLALTVSLGLVVGLPLGVAQVSVFWQWHQFRPVVRQQVEQQAGDWLRAHSDPTAIIFGSKWVGYVADRLTIPWGGSDSDQDSVAARLKSLNENPPGYCVSFKSIGWDHLTRADWFLDNYVPLQTFESPHYAASSFTVWGYRFRGVDWGERQPLNVQFPEGVNWVGYSFSPGRIQPGEDVRVTFFLQATQPFTQPYQTVVEVVSPSDGTAWARQTITPSEVLMGWWQTGGTVAERIVMTTTPDISVGAYHLDAHVVQSGSRIRLPVYQDNDAAPLDRITLGSMVVPWHDDVALERAQPVGASFGDQIRLLSFEAQDSLSPGSEFKVILYWDALRPPDDDYVVFVHLVDVEGQVVASHDGPPMDGRYATGAWLPGEVVPDVHHLVLDPSAPAGTYWLRVGMYRWPDMERFPVWDSQGLEQVERVIVLQSLAVE
ncbi:MAG: hypothetical protein GY832_44820 [Chloroflexi bacterium]|nr:hypothetical protein [Chloroflexota bacterium]